jgi:hypothetical protein
VNWLLGRLLSFANYTQDNVTTSYELSQQTCATALCSLRLGDNLTWSGFNSSPISHWGLASPQAKLPAA